MAFMFYDASIVPREQHNANTRLFHRFNAFWSRTTVTGADGTPVLVYTKKSRNLYQGNNWVSDDINKRFTNAMGMNWSDFTNQDIDSEIETIFFTMKLGSGTELARPTTEMLVDAFDKEMAVGDEVSVTISYGGRLQRYVNEHSLEWVATDTGIVTEPLNKEEIRTVLSSNPWYYLANSRHIPYVKGTYSFNLYGDDESPFGNQTPSSVPVADLSSNFKLGVMAVLDDGSMFEPIEGVFDEKVTTTGTTTTLAGEVLNYTYTLKYKYLGATPQAKLIHDIENWYAIYDQDPSNTKSEDEKITSTIDTKIKKVLVSQMFDSTLDFDRPRVKEDDLYVTTPTEADEWLNLPKSEAYRSYLKVDGVAALRKKNFVKLLSSILESDYTVEKKEWWEDILAIVIVIISIIVVVLVCMTGAGCAAAGPAGLAVMAGALGAGALTLTLGAMLLQEVGGLSSSDNIKVIGKFATVVGYAATILGIFALIQGVITSATNAAQAKANAAAAANSSVAGTTAAPVGVTDIAMEVVQMGVDKVTSIFTSTANMSVGQTASTVVDVVKLAMKGFEYYNDQEKDNLERAKSELEEEQEAYNEEIQNRQLMQGSLVYRISNERLTTPDMLQDMSARKVMFYGKDANFSAWQTDVNS